jgi:CRP-like cAMP-binding protein
MDSILPALQASELFQNIHADDLQAIAARLRLSTRTYARGEFVALEEDVCQAMGVVLSGSVHVQRILPSGKSVTIDTLRAGNSFGEAIMFSDTKRYPATLAASEESMVAFLPEAEVVRLGAQYPAFLTNFLRLLSNKILVLNRKIKSLSYVSVRQKVAHYLLEEAQRQQTAFLRLPYSRSELADVLGLPRPSLSRELAAMKAEGWIDFEKNVIKIVDAAALRAALEE